MGVPSNYRKNLNILPSKIGNEEREVLYKKISDEQPNLPSGIYVDDLDSGFVDFVNKEKEILTPLKENFEKFRVEYPGTKRGLDEEFENFKNK